MYHYVDQIYLYRAQRGTEERREQREEDRIRRRRRRQRQTTIEEYVYSRREAARGESTDEDLDRDSVCPQDKRQWDQ